MYWVLCSSKILRNYTGVAVQYAIEQLQQQLQQQLQHSVQVQDDIKAEARQVALQTPPVCCSRTVKWSWCQGCIWMYCLVSLRYVKQGSALTKHLILG